MSNLERKMFPPKTAEAYRDASMWDLGLIARMDAMKQSLERAKADYGACSHKDSRSAQTRDLRCQMIEARIGELRALKANRAQAAQAQAENCAAIAAQLLEIYAARYGVASARAHPLNRLAGAIT